MRRSCEFAASVCISSILDTSWLSLDISTYTCGSPDTAFSFAFGFLPFSAGETLDGALSFWSYERLYLTFDNKSPLIVWARTERYLNLMRGSKHSLSSFMAFYPYTGISSSCAVPFSDSELLLSSFMQCFGSICWVGFSLLSLSSHALNGIWFMSWSSIGIERWLSDS